MSSSELNASISVTRFGLGGRPGEIAQARRDPRGFLLAQIDRAGAEQPSAVPETAEQRLATQRAFRQRRIEIRDRASMVGEDTTTRDTTSAKMAASAESSSDILGDFLGRFQLGVLTGAGFRERWALFWTNHFAVSALRPNIATLIGPFEQEAIRPNIFGRFADLLAASSTHPAMLLYLDQANSVGPGSALGRAGTVPDGRRAGLNENFARELMELHTVGISGNYDQQDVTELARALTGWSVGGERDAADRRGRFVFRATAHEPGARTVRGREYTAEGRAQAEAVLRDLADAPETARHLCTKLARHFVSDEPSPTLIARLVAAWAESSGQLDRVAATLVTASESWEPAARKFKTPYEFLVSAHRAVGSLPGRAVDVVAPLNLMGQRAFAPPSPKGWPDVEGAWCSPSALMRRMDWTEAFAGRIGENPSTIATEALGARLSARVAGAVAGAETRREAVSILLMSPEFLRR